MTTSTERKDAVIQELRQSRKAILDLVRMLSPEQCSIVYLGEWGIAELLAHLNGWDETNLRAIQELQESKLPEFYDHIDPDWRRYNAMLVERYRLDDVNTLIQNVTESNRRLLALAITVEPRDFERDWGVRYKGYRVTIARLLEAEAKDERVHARQISEYFGIQSPAS